MAIIITRHHLHFFHGYTSILSTEILESTSAKVEMLYSLIRRWCVISQLLGSHSHQIQLRRYLHSELRDKNIIDKNTSAGMKASIIEKSYGACLRNCQLYFRAIEKCDLECCITSNNKKASGFLTYATREGHSPHNVSEVYISIHFSSQFREMLSS